MRVAELCDRARFRLIEGRVEDPGPGQIQVRVEQVGICGSDLHYFSEGRIGDTPCVFPMVIGHEPSGTVVKTGAGVSGWAPGDRAVLEPAIYCYHCEFCRSGRHNVCAHIRFLSTPGDPGFFREYLNLPIEGLLPLPSGLSFGEGTLAEPLAVVAHSMVFAAIRTGERAAVFGAGPIGLMTVALLKLSGAGRIWAVEPVAHRREMAIRMGADAAIDPGAADPAREILRDTGGRGVDVAIECAARGETLNQAALATRNAGRIVLVGIQKEEHTPVNFHVLRRKEITLVSVRRSNHDTETAIELLHRYPGMFSQVITHETGMEDIQRTFEMTARYDDGAVKVLIRP